MEGLSDEPKLFPDCCAGLSRPMLKTMASRLPQHPALVLSIGCGSGLLEGLLLLVTDEQVNVLGVEVASCVNKHLPERRLLRVQSTSSLHPEALLASTLLFVYPRQPTLLTRYMETFYQGALEQVVWLGHRSDWPEIEDVLTPFFDEIEVVEGPGMMEYELLVFATLPHGR
ncbi:hypothetical protein LTR33_005188 [Friedmanniomyces endolithicus]|nr:hypothetical protein LTR33_005188 [Friedmanniomyces endolithicus]